MPRSTKKGDSKRYDISRTSHGLFFFAMFNSYSSVDFCFKINKHYFNSLNMSEIIKLSSKKSISALLTFFLLVTGCQQDEGPTERDRVIGLLTGVAEKHWVIDASNVDGREIGNRLVMYMPFSAWYDSGFTRGLLLPFFR
jgi:hypothetical protein